MRNLLFIVQCWGDSHEMMRILFYQRRFKNIKIVAYQRNAELKYNFGLFPDYLVGMTGNTWNRFFAYTKVIVYLVGEIKKDNSTYFVQGADNLIVFNIASLLSLRRPRFVYQLSDIPSVLSNSGFTNSLLRYLDRIFFAKVRTVDNHVV